LLLGHFRDPRRLEAAVGVDAVDDRQIAQFILRHPQDPPLLVEAAGGDLRCVRVDRDRRDPFDRRHVAQVPAVRYLVDRQVVVKRQEHGRDDPGGNVHRGILTPWTIPGTCAARSAAAGTTATPPASRRATSRGTSASCRRSTRRSFSPSAAPTPSPAPSWQCRSRATHVCPRWARTWTSGPTFPRTGSSPTADRKGRFPTCSGSGATIS